MGDARFLKLLGDVDRAMADAATALEQKRGVRGVSRATQIWSSPSQDSDQAIFAVYLETVNEFGYELCWTFEVTEAGGRYVVDRILYGRGRPKDIAAGKKHCSSYRQSARTNEMCTATGFYFPAAGPRGCVKAGGQCQCVL